jgi:hypothetical protein
LLFFAAEEKSGGFKLLPVINLQKEGGRELHPQPATRGRPTPEATESA